MSIEQLTELEQNFTKNLQIIRDETRQLPKSQKLRITAWLKKLCSVVDNMFWRKNRNLYAQVLAIMLQAQVLQSPFDKFPPQTSLPKITLYQIPFWIRKKLEQQPSRPNTSREKSRQKQNISGLENISYLVEPKLKHLQSTNVSINTAEVRLKRRQSAKFRSLQTTQIPSNLQNLNIIDNHRFQVNSRNQDSYQSKQKQTQRKNSYNNKNIPNISLNNCIVPEDISQAIFRTVYFLNKNHTHFKHNSQMTDLLNQIKQFSAETGINFNKQFSHSHHI